MRISVHDLAIATASSVRAIVPVAVLRSQGVHVVEVRQSYELSGELGRIVGVDHVPLSPPSRNRSRS